MFWQNSSLTEPLLFWNKKDSVFLSKPACCLQAKEVIYPILDLKTPNVFIWAKHFHVETVRLVIASLCRGDLLASVDIKDACLYIPYFLCVNPTSLLAFFFGLSIAPWGFTKVFALVLTLLCLQGIPMVGYLDKRLSSSPCRPCLPVLHQAVWEGESWTPFFMQGLGAGRKSPPNWYIGAIWLSLHCWNPQLQSPLTQIQMDNTTAVLLYNNHWRGTISLAAQRWWPDSGFVRTSCHPCPPSTLQA